MKFPTFMAIFAFIFLAVASSVDNPPEQQDKADLSNILGLGVEIPEEFPALAPLQNDQDDVREYMLFFENEVSKYSNLCTRPGTYDHIKREYYDKGFISKAYLWFIIDCPIISNEYEEKIVQSAIEGGNEIEIYESMRAKTQRTLENATILLKTIVPGNGVEALLFSRLAGNIELGIASVTTAELYFKPYKEGWAKDELQLGFVLGGFPTIINSTILNMKIMEDYPWGDGVCQHPPIEDLKKTVDLKLKYVEKLANEYGNPDDLRSISTRYGTVINDFPLRFKFYAENDWWPPLLSLSAALDQYISYFENYTAERIPTQEEARYMVAEYRSHTNTLWTESRLHNYIIRLEGGSYPWELDWHTGGHWALTLPALRSPFVDLECPVPEDSASA